MMFQQMDATSWFTRVLLRSEPYLSYHTMAQESGVTKIMFSTAANSATAIFQSWLYTSVKNETLELLKDFSIVSVFI